MSEQRLLNRRLERWRGAQHIVSIEARVKPKRSALAGGRIVVKIAQNDEQVEILVEDNGRGLPVELRERLMEPYITTRAKGTGLGLAIVKKIMEDHGGDLAVEDADECGARIRLAFPIAGPSADSETVQNIETPKVASHGA